MQKKNANDLVEAVITLLTVYLEELSDVKDVPNQQFIYGEKTAYTECLEWLMHWDKAEQKGLLFNVEQRFPL